MSVMEATGGRSSIPFGVSREEVEMMKAVNLRIPDSPITLFHRPVDKPALYYLVFSFGSRRRTFFQAHPFSDEEQIVERGNALVKASNAPRAATFTEDPDEADGDPFA